MCFEKYLKPSNTCKLTLVGDAEGDVFGLDDGAGVISWLLGEWLGTALGLFDGVEEGDFSDMVV